MSNMTFGVNIIPNANNSLTLGNADRKWNIYAETLNGTDVDEIINASGGGVKAVYTFSIPTTGWTQYSNTDLYTVTVTVNGATAVDKGILGLVQSGTESSDSVAREDFGAITRAVTAANSVVLYSTAVPSAAISVQLVVLA